MLQCYTCCECTSPLPWPSELFITLYLHSGSFNPLCDLDLEFRRSGSGSRFYRLVKVCIKISRLWKTLEASGQRNRDAVSFVFKMSGGSMTSVIRKKSKIINLLPFVFYIYFCLSVNSSSSIFIVIQRFLFRYSLTICNVVALNSAGMKCNRS